MSGSLAGRRLVGVFPHPDDESYAAGGTMARCARRGAEVTVVSATRGEAGVDLDGGLPPGAALGLRRLAELEQACEVLGLASPRCLELADGRIATHDPDDAEARLTSALADLRPEVVITLGFDGVYGHRDHLACTALVERSVSRLPTTTRPRVLHAAFPRGLFTRIWRILSRLQAAPVDAEVPLGGFGVERGAADLIVDIADARAAKLAALSAHRSQLPAGDPHKFLRPGLVDRLLAEEWFTLAAGPPLPSGAADPFAGLAG